MRVEGRMRRRRQNIKLEVRIKRIVKLNKALPKVIEERQLK